MKKEKGASSPTSFFIAASFMKDRTGHPVSGWTYGASSIPPLEGMKGEMERGFTAHHAGQEKAEGASLLRLLSPPLGGLWPEGQGQPRSLRSHGAAEIGSL